LAVAASLLLLLASLAPVEASLHVARSNPGRPLLAAINLADPVIEDFLAGDREDGTVEERILRVERGLLPAVRATGSTVTYNLADRMRQLRVPGVSVAVINNGRIEWAKGYGVVEAGSPVRVNPATMFQAASISKPVAAMGALRLVQAGKLALDEDVNKRLISLQLT